jgi:hypothetical protein
MQDALFSGMDAPGLGSISDQSVLQARKGAVSMRLADRSEVAMHFCSIDELVPPDHRVRVIWEAVDEIDLSALIDKSAG